MISRRRGGDIKGGYTPDWTEDGELDRYLKERQEREERAKEEEEENDK